uniref:Dynein heavy chain coiled coil stalk domain-containing protein n=1 Tax=Knipowitschia caucasica TaxID=637954 RepID=A0AAV2JYD5_KNICA
MYFVMNGPWQKAQNVLRRRASWIHFKPSLQELSQPSHPSISYSKASPKIHSKTLPTPLPELEGINAAPHVAVTSLTPPSSPEQGRHLIQNQCRLYTAAVDGNIDAGSLWPKKVGWWRRTHYRPQCQAAEALDKEFQPDLVASKSQAAAGLCSWVLNIVKFYQVYCEVEPKRQALSKANLELASAQDKLRTIKNKIKFFL